MIENIPFITEFIWFVTIMCVFFISKYIYRFVYTIKCDNCQNPFIQPRTPKDVRASKKQTTHYRWDRIENTAQKRIAYYYENIYRCPKCKHDVLRISNI